MYVRMYVCLSVCMSVCLYVCMYASTYACMHACIHCMYVAYLSVLMCACTDGRMDGWMVVSVGLPVCSLSRRHSHDFETLNLVFTKSERLRKAPIADTVVDRVRQKLIMRR